MARTDRPGDFCYNFSIPNDLAQMVNFPTQITGCDSHSPALLDFFLSSDASICSTMAFPPLGNFDHVVVSVSIDFPSNSQRDAPFHRIVYDCSCADWNGLHDHLYQKNKSPDSEVKSSQASNCCKRVLEAGKLAYANKTKESITSQKLGSHDF